VSLNLYDNGDKDFHSKEQQLNISKTLRSAFPNHRTTTSVFYTQESAFMNKPVLFVYRKKKEYKKMSRAKNPKYESMSLEELKANMEKSRQELEAAILNNPG
jgi:hypothetical protein